MRDYENSMPLAAIQEHFWFPDGSAAEQAPLTECVGLAVPDTLDSNALRSAVRAMLNRHEILRSAVRAEGGQPKQIVLPVPEPLPITEITLTVGAGADLVQLRDQELTRFAGTGIDPAAGGAIAFLLLRGGGPNGGDVLAVALHHLFLDATAVRLLLGELSADYDAALAGEPSPVPAPELQYSDFVRWERDTLFPAFEAADTAWWQATLRDAPTSLDLRPDRPRRRIKRGVGRRTPFVLPGVAGLALRSTARTLRCSPYALCLAGWAATIARSTGHPDLILGALAANRAVPQLKTLVGQMSNTVPLRLDLGGDLTLADATTRCSDTVAAAIEHARLPFNRIVRAIGAPRPTDRTTLIQHLFLPPVDAVGELRLGGHPVQVLDVERERGRFDTVVEIEFAGDEVRLWLEYDGDLYTPDGIDALVRDYATVLCQWLERPELRMSELVLTEPAPAPLAPISAEQVRVELPDGTPIMVSVDRSRGADWWPVLTGTEGLQLDSTRSVHQPSALLLDGSPTGLTARRDAQGRLEIVAGLPGTDSAEPALVEILTAPTSDRLLELVTELWIHALEQPGLQPDDDFFACGGHSMLATRLTAEMQETLGVPVRVRTLFENPTPAELTAHLRTANPELDKMLQLVSELSELPDGLIPDLPAVLEHSAPVPSWPDTIVDVPLLSGQRQLWLAEQADPGSLTHTIPLVLDLSGPLQPDAFAQAVNDVVAHQPGLRGTFVEVEGLPVQRIHPHTGIDVPVLDLAKLDETEREAELKRLEQDIAFTGFDITAYPLLRARIIRLDAHRHQAQLLFHHLVMDEVSMTLLMRELSTAYQARAAGHPPILPRHEVDFGTLAREEQQMLNGPEGERLRRFWVRELAGAPELRIPTDRPRGDQARFRGEFLERPTSVDGAAAVRELAAAGKTTPFAVFCAAVAVQLQILSGQHDILIGIPTANRTQRGAEQLIGCFLNVVPLRLDLSGNPRFDELVQRVRAAVLRAYEHQQAPFADIVQFLQRPRVTGKHPVYQVTCELQLESWIPAQFATGVDCDYRFLTHGTARYDMAFHGLLRSSGLSAMLELNTDLWDHASGHQQIDQVLRILAAAAAGPRTPIADLVPE